MRTKRYRVTLTPEERTDLQRLIGSGKAPARKLAHARVLLKADAPPGHHGAFDEDIAAAVEVSVATVERVRRRFVEEGLEAALVPKPSTAPHPTKLDGRGEAQLLATVASAPPDGQARWSLRLLAEHLVELSVVNSIARETVRRALKKVS
jgi:transposase